MTKRTQIEDKIKETLLKQGNDISKMKESDDIMKCVDEFVKNYADKAKI